MFRKPLMATALGCAVFAAGTVAQAQIRLIGITGNQSGDPNFLPHQEAFWEIDITDASAIQMGRGLFTADSQSIGFNSSDGMLYRTGGAESYRSGEDRVDDIGYRDNQYMEKFDPTDLTPGEQVPPSIAIFNANGPNLPPDPPIQTFALPAPRPSWLLPVEPRSSTQFQSSFQNGPEGKGPNEYHAVRGLAWSQTDQTFYIADEGGIFKLTAEGDSTFLGDPADSDPKGIAFVNIGGEERLYISSVGGTQLLQIDTATGLQIGEPVDLNDPVVPELDVPGILGLTVHPVTGDVYAVSRGENSSDPFGRELIVLDRDETTGEFTGNTTLIGSLDLNLAAIAFVFPVEPPVGQPGDTNNDGTVDLEDLNAVRNNFGGTGAVGSTPGDAYPFDGVVDLEDLNGVRNNFGAGPSNSVPEPSSVVLALAGLAVVGYRFRRR